MQTTTNYNMSKPEYSDAADIAPISGNMDTIDTALHKSCTRDADLYDETATYNVGDYCIYADTLYRCTGNAVTGTWDSTKWTLTNLGDNLTDAKKTATRAELTAVQAISVLPDHYDEDITYNVGDLCMNGALFKCIATTTGTWDSTKWQLTTLENEFERKHTWTLSETITADGNTKRYERNLTVPISGLFITFEVNAATASDVIQVYAWFGTDTTVRRAGYVNGGLNTDARYSHIRYTRDGNLWTSEQASAASGLTQSSSLGRQENGYLVTSDEMVKFRIDTNSLNFPSGSKITIYVRQ